MIINHAEVGAMPKLKRWSLFLALLPGAVGLLVLAGCLSMVSLIGYLYKVKEFYGLLRHFPRAIHTTICFFCLSLACLFVHEDKGMIRDFINSFTVSMMARRFLPVAIFVPLTSTHEQINP